MLVDLLGRARAALRPALIVAAALAAVTGPLSPAAAQMSTAPPTNAPPTGGGNDMPPMGGDMPMGGMPMGGMPGMGGDMPGQHARRPGRRFRRWRLDEQSDADAP